MKLIVTFAVLLFITACSPVSQDSSHVDSLNISPSVIPLDTTLNNMPVKPLDTTNSVMPVIDTDTGHLKPL